MRRPERRLAGVRVWRTLVAVLLLLAVGLGVGTLAALGSTKATASLGPDGIGKVRFGLTKIEAVAALSALFGDPSGRGINTGCAPRYTEVEWGDLVAEFRLHTFSGYRYIDGGFPLTTPGSPREARPKTVLPAACHRTRHLAMEHPGCSEGRLRAVPCPRRSMAFGERSRLRHQRRT
jgi:hypothetical protein